MILFLTTRFRAPILSAMTTSPKRLSDIRLQLQERILSGEWKAGEKLPSDAGLARELGCSIGTVSKALGFLVHDGLVTRRQKAGTTVLRNTAPTRPSGVQLDAFAFIYPSDRHEGISRMLHGFEDAAREKSRRLVMLPTGADFKKEVEVIASLEEFDVRGAVACPVLARPEDQLRLCQLLLKSRIPVVLAGLNLPGFCSASVLANNFEAGYAMTRHLLGQGIRNIGFLSNHSWAQFMRDRYSGYRRAMEEAGIGIPASWVHLANAMHANFNDPVEEPTSIARAYLDTRPDVKAVVCADDFMALGLIQAAAAFPIKVPSELRVTGIDGFSVAAASSPSVTTYKIPYEELGKSAFAALESLILRNAGRGVETLIKGEIVMKESA